MSAFLLATPPAHSTSRLFAFLAFVDAQSGRICLNSRNELVDPQREKWLVKGTKLLAGHFLWGE